MANEIPLLDYFSVLPSIKPNEGWLHTYGEPLLNEIILQKDLRNSRLLIAEMLTEALNEKAFLQKYNTRDRLLNMCRGIWITYLGYAAFLFGLLDKEEITQMLQNKGSVDIGQFQPQEKPLLPFEKLQEKTAEWKKQGFQINCFIGSFDPPTVLHLALMYEAGEKLIVGIDNNQLIERKGDDRPRFPLELRRQILENFPWLVAGTFVLRPSSISDSKGFSRDYKDLGVNNVFLMPDQENLSARLSQIKLAGAKPKFFEQPIGNLTSTAVIKRINKNIQALR